MAGRDQFKCPSCTLNVLMGHGDSTCPKCKTVVCDGCWNSHAVSGCVTNQNPFDVYRNAIAQISPEVEFERLEMHMEGVELTLRELRDEVFALRAERKPCTEVGHLWDSIGLCFLCEAEK